MTVVLEGALVVDGTGAPGRVTDVVVNDGRIVGIGGGRGEVGAERIDLDGLVLAPGFIDIHTHLDAQVLWDPTMSPSNWHGVTSVIMGNCGFTIAPTRPTDRAAVIATLENVEGMSAAALEAGIDWCFETFPEYLAALEVRPKRLNVGALIGHTTLRLYTLGPDAPDRRASAEEIATMRATVAEALSFGAMGFSTSQSEFHIGAWGKPVASRAADYAEISEIARGLSDVGRGIVQVQPGQEYGMAESARLSKEIGRPVTWIAVVSGQHASGGLAALDETERLGGDVIPQMSCRPIVAQFHLGDFTALVNMSEAFTEAIPLNPSDRAALYSSPAWRARADSQLKAFWRAQLAEATVDETERHRALLGRKLGDLAREAGTSPFEEMLDLSLADGLATRFRRVLFNDDEAEVGALLADDRCILGLSDAGAHVSSLCDSNFPTYLLGHWVRDLGALSLERAVWRMTGHPATVFEIPDRGRIAEGFAADLVAFDPTTVAAGPLQRRHDLPAGADRLISESTGIEHVFVNGVVTRRGGCDIEGVNPGELITPARSA